MTLHPTRIARSLAFVGFLALFPGFVIYHLLVMGLQLPPLLAGFFGPVSALLVLAYVPLQPKLLRSSDRTSQLFILAVSLLLTFLLAWSIAHRVLSPSPVIIEAFSQSWRAIVLMAATFVVGLYLPLGSVLLHRLLALVLGLGAALLVGYYVLTGDPMFYARAVFGADYGASYQGFARTALVIAVLALFSQDSRLGRVAVVVCGLIAMWFLGARSEMVGFLVATLLYFGIIGLRSRSIQVSAVVLVPVLALLVSMNVDIIDGSRHLQLLTLADASSWQARLSMNEIAITQIRESPIIGAFGGHIDAFGTSGAYAHNALSAWVSYGLLGFMGYVGLTVIAMSHSLWKVVVQGDLRTQWVAAAVFGMVVLVLIIASKSVFWSLPSFAWGLYGNALLLRSTSSSDPGLAFTDRQVPSLRLASR
jgi:hypothetical protein